MIVLTHKTRCFWRFWAFVKNWQNFNIIYGRRAKDYFFWTVFLGFWSYFDPKTMPFWYILDHILDHFLSILDPVKHQPGRKTNSTADKLLIFWQKNFFIFKVKKSPQIVTPQNIEKQTIFGHFWYHFFKSVTTCKKCLISGGKNSLARARKVNHRAPKTELACPQYCTSWQIVEPMWPIKLPKNAFWKSPKHFFEKNNP